MEMKKQVLSFTEFINEAYSIMVNEGRTWDDVKTLLSKKLDDEAKTNLAYMEDLMKSDARPGYKGDILKLAGESFSRAVAEILDGKYTNITSIDTSINQIEYNEVIQGNVFVSKSFPMNQVLGNYGAFSEADGRMQIGDLLNLLNTRNINKLSSVITKANKKGKAKFDDISRKDRQQGLWDVLRLSGEGKKIEGSGSQDLYYITKVESQIEIGKWENDKKVTPISGVVPTDMSMNVGRRKSAENLEGIRRNKDAKLKKAGSAVFTYVFYTLDPKSVKDGKNKGADKKITEIKEIKIPIKTPDVTETLQIEDNGVLFTVGTAKLTEDGKKQIYNAITQDFNSVFEIEVQGSASQEGDIKINEKLCIDRAAAVAAYLKTVSSAKVTPSTKASIQPASPVTTEAVRKTFRNVILTIKGTKIIPGSASEKTIYIPKTAGIKCDLVKINEITMNFNVEIDKDKAKKMVDTRSKGEGTGRESRK
jgi:outer membrane protein OmpA-like peptidoglycan-associated protein